MLDLHRHDEFSTFDGFGKPKELAQLAKELGHTALGTSNHGNTNGLIQTWSSCLELGIKPVLGVEGYFLPKYKEKTRGFHLCLFAKNIKGYKNLNTIQYLGEKQKFYNPIWDFKMLEKYHDGLICSSACVAGYLAQCILNDDLKKAKKYLNKMVDIFGDDFYIEVQPYKVTDKGMQEKVNYYSMILADELGIKCILTSDSHRGKKEDLDTYLKMHEIAGHNFIDVKETYSERYMPTEQEIKDRFIEMHYKRVCEFKEFSIDYPVKRANEMIDNLQEIEDKVDMNIFEGVSLELPKIDNNGKSSFSVLKRKVREGLEKKNKFKKEYIDRVKEELDVIKFHGFEDYFLIVADYVNFAKNKGIMVGQGRGSVCNCLVAYALGITGVDSLYFNLDFRRFLRKDKTKYPDIDLDFETSRRHEVIEYIVEKYKGHSARICSYGLYKVDNLINDLAKVCGLNTNLSEELTDEEIKERKGQIALIKSVANDYIDESSSLDSISLLNDYRAKKINKKYDNILKHFSKLYKKVRYIGTHAAGVAITGGNLLKYTSVKIDKKGDIYTAFDLSDLEEISVLKFDILGLKTEESIGDLRRLTGIKEFKEEWTEDKKVLKAFNEAETEGIFQFEKATPREILKNIDCDCFDDIVATSSMNRPASLSLHQPEAYAENKFNVDEAMKSKYYEYTKESYGTIIYQEQIQQICVNIGNMTWKDSDVVMKMMKNKASSEEEILKREKIASELRKKFVKGALKNGLTKEEALQLFSNMLVYSFNKGHAVGYTLISVEEMYYKMYYPTEFWFVKMKYARDEGERYKYSLSAVKNGVLVFLPHVNYSANFTLRKVDGERIIQSGLCSLKGVGMKASLEIEAERKENGAFKSEEEFLERCKGRVVNKKVIDILKEQGALEFRKKTYLNRVIKYNSALYSRL